MATRLSEQEILAKWKSENPDLSNYIEFKGINFKKEADILDIDSFRKHLMKELNSVAAELDRVSNLEMPKVGFLGFDFVSQNWVARKLCVVRQMIHIRSMSIITEKFSELQDTLSRTNKVISVLRLCPHCRLRPEFFRFEGSNKRRAVEIERQRLRALERSLVARISTFVEPIWKKDFKQFLENMVLSSYRDMVGSISYIEEQDAEISLSRCLFHRQSQFAARIDSVIAQWSPETTSDFSETLIRMCDSLLPQNIHVDPRHESLVLVYLYRALFHRFYELRGSVFSRPDSGVFRKAGVLAELPSSVFTIPEGMIEPASPSITISSLFNANKTYHAAMRFLEDLIFASNPLDMLYIVHKTIVAVQTAAQLNQRRLEPDNEQLDEVMSFDDLFSLLFGCFLASNTPDILYVDWFLTSFSPNKSLSPSFEYALANLEALCRHLRSLNAETLEKSVHL